MRDKLILFLASGFYLGKAPWAPGTFGALLGIPVACLLHSLPLSLMAAVVVLMVLGSVWVSGQAALIIGEKDPSVIVLDEVVGMGVSLCMFPCSIGYVLACFFLFRLFDIWKPGPVDSLQGLPGGWGVVMDDVLAGVFAGMVVQAGVIISHAW